jgi:putative hemolysin
MNKYNNFKYAIFFILCVLIFVCLDISKARAQGIVNPVVNPAAKYCHDLGYQWEIKDTPAGQVGVCVLSDGEKVNSWDFVQGKAGQAYSYCQKQGYKLKSITNSPVCQSAYSKDCAVCVLDNGHEYETLKLMNIESQPEKCGDGYCTKSENKQNCAQDCLLPGENNNLSQIDKGNILYFILSGIVGLIIMAVGLFIVIKKKKNNL